MISARLSGRACLSRALAIRVSCASWRSNSTTDTFDQASWWTGGRPRTGFASRGPRPFRRFIARIIAAGFC
jgi:hypothetical protein